MSWDTRRGRRGAVLWGVLAVVWLAFFAWYTSFAGPLTSDEIDGYLAAIMAERSQSPERIATIREFLENDTGDDFVIVNAIEFNSDPPMVPGVPDGEGAEAILDRYMVYMWPALLSRASHPIVFGQVAGGALDVFGIDGAEHWSQAGLMRYRSRRDMMEIATNPAFRDAHVYKVAAMAKTVAFPIDPWGQLGDPRLVLFLVFVIVGLSVERIAPS